MSVQCSDEDCRMAVEMSAFILEVFVLDSKVVIYTAKSYLTYVLSFQMRHNSRRHCLSLTLNP